VTKNIVLYKSEVAICYAGDVDINRQMVIQGMAVAYKQYSKLYVADETLARRQFRGIWAAAFMEPAQWRRYSKRSKKSKKDQTS
jgi:endonuclease YncB( thermonuclease family)